MFKLKLTAAMACGMALLAGVEASPWIQELHPKFDIYTSNTSGILAGRKYNHHNDTVLGAFSWMGIEFHFKVSGADATEVLGMNNYSEMVGSANSDGHYLGFHRNWKGKISKYLYPGSEETTFNDINDKGLILGWQYSNMENFGAFLLDDNGQAQPFVVPGFETASWYRLNNKNQVLGSLFDNPGSPGIVGALYTMGTVEIIEYPGATHTLVADLNNKGDVLAEASLPYDPVKDNYPSMAFIQRKSGEIVPLDYQPNWAPLIKEKVDGKYRWLKFSHVVGTSARALDDSGKAIIVSIAFYRAETDYGHVGFFKSRTFAIRP